MSLIKRLARALSIHRHFVLVVACLLIIMTFPTILYVFNTDVFWVPVNSGDVWITFWNAWYFKSLVAGQADFYFTNLLFYPDGLSLVYHNFTVPHMIVLAALQLVMPASNAFNVTYLLVIVSVTVAPYVYLNFLFKDKWVGLFGAIIFGFSGYVIGRPQNPGSAFLAALPLALYFLHRAILERRMSFIFISGALTGATVFADLYIFVCLLIVIGSFVLYFATLKWREKDFWRRIAVLVIVIGSLSSFHLHQLLADSGSLDNVLDKTSGQEKENDLLQYFINYENPIANRLITNRLTTSVVQLTNPGRWNTAYLGYVPLFLIFSGVLQARYRRRMIPWLILMFFFLALRLGSILTINSQQLPAVRLPKYFADQVFPLMFKAFHETDHFQIGILLPLAVLSCYGLISILERMSNSKNKRIILILIALLAVEYFRSPPGGRIVSPDEIQFLTWLSDKDANGVRLINLPMNRGNSKQYLLHQTLSEFPQVEGLARRTPPSAYNYIEANPVLNAWHKHESLICTEENRDYYLAAVAQLGDDGFSHVVLHYSLLKPDTIEGSFSGLEPAYEDEFVAIYPLAVLAEACP